MIPFCIPDRPYFDMTWDLVSGELYQPTPKVYTIMA